MYKHAFSDEELSKILALEKQMLQNFKSLEGSKTIEYEGKKFIILPDVFWPSDDSRALARNFVINSGEEVLDVGTGTGVLAVFAALKGASKVVALDISSSAVENTKANVNLHGFSNIIDVRLSDIFDSLNDNENFDVIIANLPFEEKMAKNIVEESLWDIDLRTNKKFFEEVKTHLKPDGRIYLAQSNFGAVDEVLALAESKGFVVKLIGQTETAADPRIFYAFELKLKT